MNFNNNSNSLTLFNSNYVRKQIIVLFISRYSINIVNIFYSNSLIFMTITYSHIKYNHKVQIPLEAK